MADTLPPVNPNANYATLPGGSPGTAVTDSAKLSTPPTYTAPTSLTSANVTPATPVNLPTPPAPTPTNVGGTQTTIDQINASMAAITARQQALQDQQAKNSQGTSPDLQSLFQQYLGSQTPPPSASDQYNSLYSNSGIADKQAAATASNNKVTALNAQLAGLNYNNNTVIPNQVQSDAQGREITKAGTAIQTASQQRAQLLQIAPLQLQLLSAQAEATGNNNILDAAQKHLDSVFQIQSQDATNQYNYQSNLNKAVYDYASAAEKTILDNQQKAQDQAHTDQQAALTRANTDANLALQNGQGDLAAKIMALDHKSPTYQADEAALKGQIVDKTTQLDNKYKQAQIDKIYSDMNATSQNGGLLAQTNTRQTTSGITYVDGTNLTGKDATQAQTFAAQNGLPYLDKTAADLQNNVETARQNMTNIQNSLDGLLPTSGLNVTAKLGNLLQSSTQIGPNADALSSFSAYRSAAIQALRAMAGAKGLRINQAEIMQSVNNDIPKITDTVGVAKSKIAIVNALLDSQEKGTFGSKFYKTSGTNSTQTQSSTSAANPLGI